MPINKIVACLHWKMLDFSSEVLGKKIMNAPHINENFKFVCLFLWVLVVFFLSGFFCCCCFCFVGFFFPQKLGLVKYIENTKAPNPVFLNPKEKTVLYF